MVPEGGAVTSCHRGYTECLSLTSPGSLQLGEVYHAADGLQGESMSDWASRSANARQQARDRKRRRRQAAIRAAYAERGIDPAKVCGLTQKPCAYAVGCAWNEEQRRAARLQKGKSEVSQFRKGEGCVWGIRNELDRCLQCPHRSRCSKVWRCFRAERLAAGAPDLCSDGGSGSDPHPSRPKGRGAFCNAFATGLRGHGTPAVEGQRSEVGDREA